MSLAPDRFLIFPTRGTLNIGAAPGQPATGAGTLNAGAVQFGAGIATLSFNHTDTAYRFATRLLSTGSGAHSLNQIAGTTFWRAPMAPSWARPRCLAANWWCWDSWAVRRK